MRKLMLILFLLPILLFIDSEAKNIMRIEPSVSVIKPGETIEINISIIPQQDVAGAQCDVVFDGNVIHVLDVANGFMFEYWVDDIKENFTEIDNQNGAVYNIVAFSGNSTNESGIFARIIVEAVGEGMSYLNITNATLSDEEGNATELEIINGSIIVDGEKPVINLVDAPSAHDMHVHFKWNATDDVTLPENILFSYMLEGYSNWSSWDHVLEKNYELSVGNYIFRIRARDEAGNIGWLNYSFNITNSPPSITLLSPSNGSTGISLNPLLSVEVSDADGDLMNVSFYNVSNGLIGTVSNVASGSNASITWNDLSYNTTYSWYVVVSDGIVSVTSPIWHFTTKENTPPKCSLQASPPSGNAPLKVTFFMNASDAGGNIVFWKLDVDNDGIAEYNGSGNLPTTRQYNYVNAGTYVANFSVIDNEGAVAYDTVTISVTPPLYTLTVTVSPANAGSIVLNPAGGKYEEGTLVEVTANANEGYSFSHWEGNEDGTDSTIYITMDSDKNLIAYFVEINENPVALFNFTPYHPSPGVEVHFISQSYDDGVIVNHTWDFGDGNISYEKNPTHVYSKEGNYTVSLLVIDDNGASNETSMIISVLSPEFVLENVSYFPKNFSEGDNVYIEVEVRNDGGYGKDANCSLYVNDMLVGFAIFNISHGEEKKVGFYFKAEKKNKVEIVIGDSTKVFYVNSTPSREKKINYLYFLILIFILLAVALYFLLYRKKEIVIEKGEKKEKCLVCLGRFKEGAEIVRCKCGATFHESCASRIKECPNCGSKLKRERVK